MTVLDALRWLIADGRTAGLADKTAQLCTLRLISAAERDTVIQEIAGREAGRQASRYNASDWS